MTMMMATLMLPMVIMKRNGMKICASYKRAGETATPAGEAATQGVGVLVTHVRVVTNPNATRSAKGVGVWVTHAGETATQKDFGDPWFCVWATHGGNRINFPGATVMHQHELITMCAGEADTQSGATAMQKHGL